MVEALAFAMFIVADTYSLAKCDKDRAIAVIHGFYDDVQDYFIKQIIIKDHQIADADEIQALADKFHDLSRRRFDGIWRKIQTGYFRTPWSMSCPELQWITYLSPNEEKPVCYVG